MKNRRQSYEQLPSGKTIIRHFAEDGSLKEESQGYGLLEIGITYFFENGVKTEGTYFAKKRMVGRRKYEKARVDYPDMPAADGKATDFGTALMREIRAQQRQKKAAREKRLAESAESRFSRPQSTNWVRVIAGEKAHLVVFASRDWKVLSREFSIRSAGDWLQIFGFNGPPGSGPNVAKGVEIGFEVPGDRDKMLAASKALLKEVLVFVTNLPEKAYWQDSIRPRPKRKSKEPDLVWPIVLPPLIDFLTTLEERHIVIFNHHQ